MASVSVKSRFCADKIIADFINLYTKNVENTTIKTKKEKN